jgi:hypothetical protein
MVETHTPYTVRYADECIGWSIASPWANPSRIRKAVRKTRIHLWNDESLVHHSSHRCILRFITHLLESQSC